MTDPESEDLLARFSEIVSIIEKNLKYIESLDFEVETLQDYRKVVSFLKRKTPEEIGKIIGGQSSKKKPKKNADPQITDADLANLSAVQVKTELLSLDLSRSFLERLASVRFGVTKGALSTLRSRDALQNKLITLLEHEGTHFAISRAVSGGYDPKD